MDRWHALGMKLDRSFFFLEIPQGSPSHRAARQRQSLCETLRWLEEQHLLCVLHRISHTASAVKWQTDVAWNSLSLETFIIHHESLQVGQVGSERQKHVQKDCRALLLASICYGFLSIASLLDSYMRFQHRILQTSVEIPANSSNIKH